MTRRARCPHCLRPLTTCLCLYVTHMPNRVELVILQHPLEVNNAKNTAGLLHLSLDLCQVHIGEKFSADFLSALLGKQNKTNLLLYPASSDSDIFIAPSPPLPDTTRLLPQQIRLIVLDGTWRKSRKMLYLNPALQQLPRLALTSVPASRYHIRKAQGEDQLSTLEASCYALQQLEGERVDYQPLLAAFDQFIARQLTFVPR